MDRFLLIGCNWFELSKMVSKMVRNIRGLDYLIRYRDGSSKVHMYVINKDFGRFTTERFDKISKASKSNQYFFIKNKNLHNLPNSLNGTLALLNGQIGLIQKQKGFYALFHVLMPCQNAGTTIIVNLADEVNVSGCYLQQIYGDRIGIPSRIGVESRHSYPYMDRHNNLCMDPAGPHVFVVPGVKTLPSEILEMFIKMPDDLSITHNEGASKCQKRLRKNQDVHVLYILDEGSRRMFPNGRDVFYVPLGKPAESVTKDPCGHDLYTTQEFVVLEKNMAKTLKKSCGWYDEDQWREHMLLKKKPGTSIVTLLIPNVRYELRIKIVTHHEMDDLKGRQVKNEFVAWQHAVHFNGQSYLFTNEKKESAKLHGVMVSGWVKGDALSKRKELTYEFVHHFMCCYGKGFSSRPRSSCLDSMNCYRDKRFNPRVHPSPFVADDDIPKMQYSVETHKKHCLLQPVLEKILHQLANDLSFIGERMNPIMMRIIAYLASKLIATCGHSLMAFLNGLHLDEDDEIARAKVPDLFLNVKDEELQRSIKIEGASFPTTCGYQHVWKNPTDSHQYQVHHAFVMEGLGVAVNLDDKTCHHFMGSAFTHCTSLCVLENRLGRLGCVVSDVTFKVFAWGSGSNKKTVRGNRGRVNRLGDHRRRVAAANPPGGGGPVGGGGEAAEGAHAEEDGGDEQDDDTDGINGDDYGDEDDEDDENEGDDDEVNRGAEGEHDGSDADADDADLVVPIANIGLLQDGHQLLHGISDSEW